MTVRLYDFLLSVRLPPVTVSLYALITAVTVPRDIPVHNMPPVTRYAQAAPIIAEAGFTVPLHVAHLFTFKKWPRKDDKRKCDIIQDVLAKLLAAGSCACACSRHSSRLLTICHLSDKAQTGKGQYRCMLQSLLDMGLVVESVRTSFSCSHSALITQPLFQRVLAGYHSSARCPFPR